MLAQVDGISRLDLAGHGHRSDGHRSDASGGNFPDSSEAAINGSSGGGDADSSGRRNDYIYGRGDGSILHPKFTGLAVYARDSLVACGRIKILKVATCATAVLTSKGGAACCLSLDGQSVALVSCHLEVCRLLMLLKLARVFFSSEIGVFGQPNFILLVYKA
jgi:hypothetical protein